MSTATQTRADWLSFLQRLIVIGVASTLILALLDYVYDFAKLWDFRVYLKAQASFFETGNPYYEAESLRFIYPPSASFIFYLINDSTFFGSVVFALNGAAWIMTACVFCRSKFDLCIVIPALLLLFGMQGWVAILTGNIACLLYFSAAIAGFLYHHKAISTLVFVVVILCLTVIKPFYAEFLIFIWLAQGIRSFLLASFLVIVAFFAINLIFYPELFEYFLTALKFDHYDTEIYGITLFSHLSSLGFNSLFSIGVQFLLIGILFILFVLRLPSLSHGQQFLYIFILAVFINPKHITYDLMVALPALVILLAQSHMRVIIVGVGILMAASVFDFNAEGKPYFQWWYAFLTTFIIVLISGKFQFEGGWQRIFFPTKKLR